MKEIEAKHATNSVLGEQAIELQHLPTSDLEKKSLKCLNAIFLIESAECTEHSQRAWSLKIK